ncbi:MAG: hypothetical protein R6W75_07350 [Smithellaceae bacterium]
MAITPYHLDSVINAYTRQNKVKVVPAIQSPEGLEKKFKDVVSLSEKEDGKSEELDKISYSLRDVILKSRDI